MNDTDPKPVPPAPAPPVPKAADEHPHTLIDEIEALAERFLGNRAAGIKVRLDKLRAKL